MISPTSCTPISVKLLGVQRYLPPTKLSPQWVVGMSFGQHVHTLGRMLLQEDPYWGLAIGHDSGDPGQVVGQHCSQQSW